MKRTVIPYLLAAALLSAVGCSETGPKPTAVLKADLDQAEVVTINPDDITWLETNDSSMIYDISNVLLVNGRILVQSRSLWKIFSSEGRYLGEVAQNGDGPENFIWMGNIWNDDSLAYLFDYKLNKIQKYDSYGRYHGYDTIRRGDADDYDAHPGEAYPTKDDGVFYVNTYLGDEPSNYVFCHATDFDSDPKGIVGRRHENGHTFYNRIFVDNERHRLLYWEHIKDTLFAVNTDSVWPLYIFDYGKNRVPEEITGQRSVVQRFLDLQAMGDNDYAYPMRYFQTHGGKIYFVIPKGKHGYIGCIDEEKDEVAFTEFVTPDGRNLLPQMFFKIDGDDILLSVIDEDQPEANPGLLRFPVSALNKP